MHDFLTHPALWFIAGMAFHWLMVYAKDHEDDL